MTGELGPAIAKAARDLVGTPFRLHGRDPQFGLDCIGVVEVALRRAGITSTGPTGYKLRSGTAHPIGQIAASNNLEPVGGAALAGDIIVLSPGPAQMHLMVSLGREGAVHADAGLRKVVCIPRLPQWPILAHLRAATVRSGA